MTTNPWPDHPMSSPAWASNSPDMPIVPWPLPETMRTTKMMATPATCHHTLTSPRILTRLTPKVLMIPWAASTAR